MKKKISQIAAQLFLMLFVLSIFVIPVFAQESKIVKAEFSQTTDISDGRDHGVTLQNFVSSNPVETLIATLSVALILAFVATLIVYIRNERLCQMQIDIERYRILSEISEEIIFEYDVRGDRLILSNYEAIFKKNTPVIEHFLQKIKNGDLDLDDEDQMRIKEAYENHRVNENLNIDIQCKMAGGQKEWMRVITKIVYDKKNQPIRAIGKMVSIEKEKREHDILLKKAHEDPLTGLYNRVYFEEMVAYYLDNRSEGEEGALMVVDLDCFKNVNDILGHQIGDEVLSDLGKTMRENFRSADILGRLGGDEFMIFVKNSQNNFDSLSQRAEELCRKTDKVYSKMDKKVEISLSIGITVSRPGKTFDDLYNEADCALYYVKEHGKNSFNIYKENQEESNV